MNQVQNISFHGQTVSVFSQNKTQYVAMRPIVENIGLSWDSQFKKIQRHEILNSTVVMMTMVAPDGKKREMLCLPLDYLNGWLFGVDARRVKPEIKDRLLTYQRECFRVLNNHFNQPKQTIKLPAPANADILFIDPMEEDGYEVRFSVSVWDFDRLGAVAKSIEIEKSVLSSLEAYAVSAAE